MRLVVSASWHKANGRFAVAAAPTGRRIRKRDTLPRWQVAAGTLDCGPSLAQLSGICPEVFLTHCHLSRRRQHLSSPSRGTWDLCQAGSPAPVRPRSRYRGGLWFWLRSPGRDCKVPMPGSLLTRQASSGGSCGDACRAAVRDVWDSRGDDYIWVNQEKGNRGERAARRLIRRWNSRRRSATAKSSRRSWLSGAGYLERGQRDLPQPGSRPEKPLPGDQVSDRAGHQRQICPPCARRVRIRLLRLGGISHRQRQPSGGYGSPGRSPTCIAPPVASTVLSA